MVVAGIIETIERRTARGRRRNRDGLLRRLNAVMALRYGVSGGRRAAISGI